MHIVDLTMPVFVSSTQARSALRIAPRSLEQAPEPSALVRRGCNRQLVDFEGAGPAKRALAVIGRRGCDRRGKLKGLTVDPHNSKLARCGGGNSSDLEFRSLAGSRWPSRRGSRWSYSVDRR
jgi:hypothetical protein